MPDLHPGCATAEQLSDNVHSEKIVCTRVLVRLSSGTLPLARLSLGCCGHRESELTNKSSPLHLMPAFPCFQNKMKNKA